MPILLILVFLPFVIGMSCSETENQGGGATDVPQQGISDDDDDNIDPNGCAAGVEYVYNCGHYFIKGEQVQSQQDAYTECLALGEISDAWICRLNCMQGSSDCNMLLNCLALCPVP